MAKDGRKLAFKPNEKSSTTHHAEGNSMASPTQMLVGKSIPNTLIAEDLLKILRDLISLFSPKSPTNSRQWNDRTTKGCIHFFNEMNHKSELSCLKLTLLTVKSFECPGGSC